MGWTYMNRRGDQRKATIVELLRQEMPETFKRVSATSVVGSAVYAVFEMHDYAAPGDYYLPCPDGKYRTLLVFLTRDGTEWGYKAMDESVGPYIATCPASLLAMLSPLRDCDHSQYAREFRARCMARAEAHAHA